MTAQNMVNRRIPVQLTVLTPVAVGDGGKLSPLTDYVYEPGENPPEVIRIDPAKLEKQFVNNPNLLELFIQGTRKNATKDKLDFLRNFIEQELDSDALNFKKGDVLPAYGMEAPTEISTIVKDVQQLYIPGTTIKGALKTAFLYNWMLTVEGEKSPEQRFKQALRTARNRASVENQYATLENQLFGDVKAAQKQNIPLDFSRLKVQDAFGISKKKLAVYNTRRLRTRLSERSGSNIDAVTEAIDRGATAYFDLLVANNILEPITSSALQFLNTDDAFRDICRIINRFSLDFLDLDKKYIEKIWDDGLRREFYPYLAILNNLKHEIENAQESTAYIRLGSGKTYFNNSIGMTIENSAELFESLRKFFRMGKEGQKTFPITRRVTLPECLPMGWVKLELKPQSV